MYGVFVDLDCLASKDTPFGKVEDGNETPSVLRRDKVRARGMGHKLKNGMDCCDFLPRELVLEEPKANLCMTSERHKTKTKNQRGLELTCRLDRRCVAGEK